MENSIVSPSYWRAAAMEVKNLRRLMFAALISALSIVIGGFYVAVGENLRVYFTFFLTATGCAVYGPVLGIMAAAVTDTLNYLLFPSGAYFPGYLLSEMVAALIYSLFLYRKRITVLRLFGAKLLVNYLVNVAMGSLWSQILFGKGYLYYLVKSLIKNSLLLPVEVIIMAAVFAAVIPIFSRVGMLPQHNGKALRRLSVSASAPLVLGLDCLFGGACSLYYRATLESGGTAFLVLAGVLGAIGLGLIVFGWLRNRKMDREG